MISKEKLLKGYIKNDIKEGGELFNKWKEACLLYEFGTSWMSGSAEETFKESEGCYIDRFEDFNGCGVIENFLGIYPDYVELTLADFEDKEERESSLEQGKGLVSQYRYEKVDMIPAEIFRAMLDGETFYVNEEEMYWNGNAFWCNCDRVHFIEDDHEICRKVEVKWQDEVESSCFWFEYNESYDSVHLNTKNSIPSEDFLAMCRVALRATGELK